MGRKNLHSMKSLVKRLLFLALIVLGATGAWAQTPTRILEDIPVNWTVTADGNTVTVTPYYTGSPLGSAVVPEGAEVVLTPTGPDKPRVKDVELLTPKEIPLTFEAMVDNATVTFTKASTLPNLSIEYSKNGEEWTAYSEPITLNIGEKVSFRGDNTTYATSYDNDSYSRFSCTNQCYVYGNIMSLINSDTNDYATNKTLEGAYAFCKLFFSNNNIYSHASKELILPATTLSAYCYDNMFYQCSNLTKAPVLPATTLTDHCYFGMFMYCHGITTAPELPAKTLAPSCYFQMFAFTNIIATPELPAKTLATSCYKNMFQGCTYLTTATALPATTLASKCYSYMFTGCSNLTTAPALPATTLANSCYSRMFNGCTKLNSVTCLATNISATNCTTDWLAGVAATGTFYKPSSMTSWLIDNPSGIPLGWTEKPSETFLPLTFEAKEANATVTFTSTMATAPAIEYSKNGGAWTAYTEPINLADSGNKVSFRGTNAAYATGSYFSRFTCTGKCYSYGNVMSLIDSIDFATKETLTEPFALSKLFRNNSNLYSHPEKSLLLPATTLSENCYYFMFSGCSNLTTAPALPATTLATGCYLYMFQSCSSLTTAPELPATTLANNCYSSMFASCSSLTAAPELPATTLTNACYMEMFNGCSSLTAAPMLPATTLVDFCYYLMFLNCSSLNSVTCLATDITAEFCTTNWLKNVAATGTFNKASGIAVGEGGWTPNNASGIPEGWTVVTYETLLPLTFEAKTAGAVVSFFSDHEMPEPPTVSIEYSLNDGAWTAYSAPITLNNVGDKVSFQGDNDSYSLNKFSCSNDCYIYGNIMSLVNPTNFTTATTLTEGYAFNSLFEGNDKIYNHASKMLVLPATTLTQSCYAYMFRGCTNFTVAPALPAVALANNCYESMFEGCTGLTAAPNLPANNLTQSCYAEMFKGCTSLTTAPNLPATYLASSCYSSMFDGCTNLLTIPTSLPAMTLQNFCYSSMFNGCTSLTAAPNLPAQNLTQSCYAEMFKGCTSLATAPTLPATTLAHQCYSNMFSGCTSLTTAPELPATTLFNFCYNSMFRDCSSLTSAPKLPATTLEDGCYQAMFHGCTSLTTAPTLPATELRLYCYRFMFEGCTNMNKVTCLATSITATDCTTEWLNGVAETGTFYKDPSMTSWPTGNASGIPSGWTVDDDPLSTPLTFEAKTAGAMVTFTKATTIDELPIEYSLNGGAWTTYTGPITLTNTGDKVSFRGDNATYATNNSASHFSCNGDCYIYGNIMSLINKNDYATTTELTEPSTFFDMFSGNGDLYSHPDKSLLLPATTLTTNCYCGMFNSCENLTAAPALPAETLQNGCYSYMFVNCVNLTTAPELPAMTLAEGCYYCMFMSCSSLTSAPTLPATTLVPSCYASMFDGCSNLNSVTCLATDISADNCTTIWLNNVAATGTFNKPMSMNGWTINSSDGIPAGWTTIHVASFTSPQAIIKFTLKNKANDAAINATSLAFTDGTNTYTIKPASATSVIYVAIPGFSGQNIRLIATVGTTIYHYEEDNVTFDNGSNYEIEVKMTDFNTEAGTNPTLDLFSDIDVEGFIFTITRADGVVDFNGHEMTTRVFIQNNTSGKTVTLQNGFISSPSDGIDGKNGWGNFYYGTVRLINMTVPGNIFTDGHAYIIDGGTYANVENVTYLYSTSYPASVTINGGYYDDLNHLDSDSWGWNYVKKGSYTLYGGYYKFNPSERSSYIHIASGYHVETVSGEYGWRVVPNSGLFSVSSTKQVYFSQGNLQAVCTSADNDGSTQESWSWQFAANQWDYVGSTAANTSINGNGSVSAAGTVDLFGWVGASSTWTGAAQYGISNSTAMNSTGTYGNNASEALKSDWGNTIGTGWRTLTTEEWQYLFSNHTNGWSTVNGVGGYVIRPDGVSTAVASSYTTSDWASQEAAGSVFLPAAGRRNASTVGYYSSHGLYWSSSNTSSENTAYGVYFKSDVLYPADEGNRRDGFSVRLVRDAN